MKSSSRYNVSHILQRFFLITVFLTTVFLTQSSFSKGMTTFCSDKFDLYKLWPSTVEEFTFLVTQVCCGKKNTVITQVPRNIITLQIQMDVGSSIKIANKDADGSGPIEIECNNASNGKCLTFNSLKNMPEYKDGLMLRVYHYDVKKGEVTYGDDTPPFFKFSKTKGNIKIVGADESNLVCEAKP